MPAARPGVLMLIFSATMHWRSLFTLLLLAVFSAAKADPCDGCGQTVARFVHQDGASLMDENGKPLALRGVNLGGWLLWEGWIWGADLNIFKLDGQSQTRLLEKMASIIGKEETEQFAQEVFDSFITERDIAAIAEMGFNSVRVPLNHRAFESGGKGFEYLDRLLRWCEQHQVYVVLDLHAAPGGQSRLFTADPDGQLLWKSAEQRERTATLWKGIAQRYASRSIVAGYDLLNEPVPPSGRALVDLYRQIISSIREVDPNHLLILEGANFAKDFSMFTAPMDANQAYSFHFYSWFGEDPKKALKPWVAIANQHRVPLWAGEFGENATKEVIRTLDVFDAQTPALAGWSFWTWKKARNGSPALNEIPVSTQWRKFVNWAVNGRGRAPTPPELRAAKAEFIRAFTLETTIGSSDTREALAAHSKRSGR